MTSSSDLSCFQTLRKSNLGLTAASLAIAVLMASCAGRSVRCAAGESRWQSETLYFGASRTEGRITVADWQWFLDTEITPRFPAGLTWWTASGQWRGKDAVVGREPSYVLRIVHPSGAQADRSVQQIIEHYRADFEQESVLREREIACVTF